MYKAGFGGETRCYDNINEDDAYFIAFQVLKKMRDEATDNPEYFRTYGFSTMYNALVTDVLETANCIADAHGWEHN